LGMGTKYLIDVGKSLSAEKIAQLMTEEKGKTVTAQDVLEEAGCSPDDIQKISLGTRHMLAYAFTIHNLAVEAGMEPADVLKRQKMLVILNTKTCDEIIGQFVKHKFFGFDKENVMFMVQRRYHGITIRDDEFVFDEESPKRLHNHGQMVMQETMDDEIFTFDGERHYLKSHEFAAILEEMDDKQSFCIEDLAFLLNAIELESLSFALKAGEQGYHMVMEIVGNNPENPQKGGMAAFDSVLDRNVMIESFRLLGLKNADIKYLNKNFNHYPHPLESWKKLKEEGLNMPLCVKENYLYFEPVQGDINFIVKTEFMQRKVLTKILHWKSPGTIPLTLNYLKKQDELPGFLEFAEQFTQ